MKMNLKKRLAIFLSILFVLPAMVNLLPMNTLEVSAATKTYLNMVYGASKGIQVEAGQEFYFGDYAYIEEYTNNSFDGSLYASQVKASYTSSKKAVAEIDNKGYIKTKKAGKAKVTVSYKGKKVTCALEVVPAGTLMTESEASVVKQVEDAAEVLANGMVKKVTLANGYSALKNLNTYTKVFDDTEVNDTISKNGFLKEEVTSGGYSYRNETNKLVAPMAGRYYVLNGVLADYGRLNNPTGTFKAKQLKIASISATASTIKVKTTKKVNDVQLLAANIVNLQENAESLNKKTAMVAIYLWDSESYKTYIGLGQIKKGSKEIKFAIKQWDYKDGKTTYKPAKLVKGHTYQIDSSSSWSKARKITIK